MDLHVFPIPIPPPTSLSTSLRDRLPIQPHSVVRASTQGLLGGHAVQLITCFKQ